MIVLRKVAVVAMSVFGAAFGPLRQAQVILMVLVVCLIGEIAGRPYKAESDRQKILGRLELGALVVEWGTMWAGIMIFASVKDESLTVALTITVAVVNAWMIAWLVSRLIRECYHEKKQSKIAHKIADFLSKKRKRGKKAPKSNSGKPGHRSVATAGDVELSVRTKKKKKKKKKVRSMKGNGRKCPKCGQRRNAAALEPGDRIQRKRHRRQSSQVSDLVDTERLYGRKTLERSHSTGKIWKAAESGPALSSQDLQLDLMMSKKKLQKLNKRGLKGRRNSFQSFKGRLTDFAGFLGTGVTGAASGKGRDVTGGGDGGDWDVLLDDKSGYYYRVNRTTGETEWLIDSEDAEDDQAGSEEDEGEWANADENPNIEERYDEVSGCYYQVNMTTGDSRWLDDGDDDYDDDYDEDYFAFNFQADANPLYRSREEENEYIYDTALPASGNTLVTKSGKIIHRDATRLTQDQGMDFLKGLATGVGEKRTSKGKNNMGRGRGKKSKNKINK